MGFWVNLSRMLDNLHIYLAIVLLTCAHYSDKYQIRSATIYAGLILLLIGYSINISNASNGVKYFGTFLIVIGSYAPFPGVVAWCASIPTFESALAECLD